MHMSLQAGVHSQSVGNILTSCLAAEIVNDVLFEVMRTANSVACKCGQRTVKSQVQQKSTRNRLLNMSTTHINLPQRPTHSRMMTAYVPVSVQARTNRSLTARNAREECSLLATRGSAT